MKRISLKQARGKKEFKREEHQPYSSKALKGPSYYTMEEGEDGFDTLKYYID